MGLLKKKREEKAKAPKEPKVDLEIPVEEPEEVAPEPTTEPKAKPVPMPVANPDPEPVEEPKNLLRILSGEELIIEGNRYFKYNVLTNVSLGEIGEEHEL